MPNYPKKLSAILRSIAGTVSGREAAMYPHVRDLFVLLGHSPDAIETDTRQSSGGRPDVRVDGYPAASLLTPLRGWIVVEAKDEAGVFQDEAKTEKILGEKWRYVCPDTEWFVAVDPQTIRVRHIHYPSKREQPEPDDVVLTSDHESVWKALSRLSFDQMEERPRLRNFRSGAEKSFAHTKVDSEVGRDLFVSALGQAAQDLHRGVTAAMKDLTQKRAEFKTAVAGFREFYPAVTLDIHPGAQPPLKTKNTGSVHVSEVADYRERLRLIRETCVRHPEVVTLEHVLWPSYRARIETAGKDGDAEADALLADETAAMLLSRIILLRFFEDYEYFGRRYLCNGGVGAFQTMRNKLGQKYPALIRTAYQAGTDLYPSVFELQPLDWVLQSKNEAFSATLEHAMMLLAVFDFTTVREELLSGLYGMFFDESQRKRRGEHYTPPTVARWMVRRACTWTKHKTPKLLDPACGFGTFLVGGWTEMVGKECERGAMESAEAEAALTSVCGNDLNHFSAALAQMQLLWTVIQTRTPEQRGRPLPPLNISSGFDSLGIADLATALDELEVTSWSGISSDRYPMVVGNPPWVRIERRDEPMTQAQEQYFEPIGNGTNLYALFLYRSLDHWVEDGGVVAFVVQQSLLDSKDTANIRELFRPGGRFQLLELVDFEVVKRAMFPDANIRPLIIFARKRTAHADDKVAIRIVAPEQVRKLPDGRASDFELDNAPARTAALSDVFGADGRWLLRCTEERMPLIKKFRRLQTFRDIAFRTYDVCKGASILRRETDRPSPTELNEGERIKESFAMGRGAVERRKSKPGRHKIIKGENLLPCQVCGFTAEELDPQGYDDPAFWKFPNALPKRFVAFTRITQLLTAAVIDPREIACLDTLSLFGPINELADFPFDLLIRSTPYQWYHLVALREGMIADYYCQAYKTTVESLPWSSRLSFDGDELSNLRAEYLEVSRGRYKTEEVTLEALRAAGSTTLKERVRANESMVIRWGGARPDEQGFEAVQFGNELSDKLGINDAVTAAQLRAVLKLFPGESLDRKDVESLPLPIEGSEEQHAVIIGQHQETDRIAAINGVLARLDRIVAEGLGFTAKEVEFMRTDLSTDPLFSRLETRHPFQPKTIRGLLKPLADSKRYE